MSKSGADWGTTHVCGHVLCFVLLPGLIHNWDTWELPVEIREFMEGSSIITWLLLTRNVDTIRTTCCQSAKNSSNQKIRETKGLQLNLELRLSSDRYKANFSMDP